jgi:putative peptidoglycan lipid II flippase
MSLFKSTAIIAFFTLLSRISGLLRDLLMANLVGAGFLSDAFFVAFKLPNFFRRLFAEGAFNAAFIPSFTSVMTAEGRAAAIRFAGEAMSVLGVALIVLNMLFLLFMPWLLPLFAPGFTDDPEKYDLTVTLARLCFPYILFMSLVSLLAGILNTLGKFAAPAAAPILLNLCMIFALLALRHFTPTAVHAMAIGVLLAGLAQFAFLAIACFREGALPGFYAPRITEKVKKMLLLMAPAALGSSVQQLNLLVDTIIASTLPGAVSYLYYADRLTELPIGMIGVAVATAILPLMSRQFKEGKLAAAHYTMNRALEIVLLFGLPASAALFVIAEPIISVIYEHGEFTRDATIATYQALMAFAVGLPAFLMVKIFAPGFYASHDTKTPFKIAFVCVVVNLVLNLTLIHVLEHVGMALATSIASWLNTFLLARTLYKRGLYLPDASVKRRLSRMLASTTLMVAVLLLGVLVLPASLPEILSLGILVAGGGSVYLLSVWFSGGVDKTQLMSLFRRRSQIETPPEELEG